MKDKDFLDYIGELTNEISTLQDEPSILKHTLKAISQIIPSDAIHILTINQEDKSIQTMQETQSYSLKYGRYYL